MGGQPSAAPRVAGGRLERGAWLAVAEEVAHYRQPAIYQKL